MIVAAHTFCRRLCFYLSQIGHLYVYVYAAILQSTTTLHALGQSAKVYVAACLGYNIQGRVVIRHGGPAHPRRSRHGAVPPGFGAARLQAAAAGREGRVIATDAAPVSAAAADAPHSFAARLASRVAGPLSGPRPRTGLWDSFLLSASLPSQGTL
jgi:hypothetical protein